MAREQSPSSASDSDGARPTVALVAALLLVASVFAPVSTTAAVGPSDRAPVVADATPVANDGTTTVTDDGTTTTVAGNESDTTTAGDETNNTTTAGEENNTTTAGEENNTTTAGEENNTTTVIDDSVTLHGTVTDVGGDPVTNDSMRLGSVDSDVTDEYGRYRLHSEQNGSYELTYRQAGDGARRDGVPAVYAVGRVNSTTDGARNVSLPAASVLNVTVVAQNRTRIDNATVRLSHENSGANESLVGRTDAQGRLTVGGRVGVELAGTVAVAVEAPYGWVENRTVTVQATGETREVVLPLDDSDPPTLRYDVSPRRVNVSEPVTFDASNSTDESGIEETTWTVDGQPVDSPVVQAPFSEPGNYTPEVVVTDWAGNEVNATVPITVVDEVDPDPALSANATTVLTNESVRFDASNASDNHRIATYRWDFDGDGVPDRNTSVPTAVHEYAENGTFSPTVAVEDETGNRANATLEVTVERPPPTAAFSVTNVRPYINESVTFDASPSRAAGNLTEYVWTFEDGKQVPDRRVITTRFPDSGTYNVTLTVADEYGRNDDATRTVVVPNKPPQADAGSNLTVETGAEVELDGSYSTDPDDDFAVEWNQTRGPAANLSDASAVAPTFVAPNVTATERLRFVLTVTDDHGATDADSVSVAVAPNATPDVTHSPTTPAVGESVTFRANRSGEYSWDFDGDGTPEARSSESNATNATATYRFDAPGEYTVTLFDVLGRSVNHTVTVVAADDSDGGGTGDSGGSGGSAGGSDGGGSSTGGGDAGGSSTSGGVSGATGGGSTGDTGGSTGGGSSASGSSSTGDDGSESGVNDADAPDETPASPSVTVERVGDGSGSVVAAVENAAAGDPATVRLPEGFGGGDSAFESISVVPDGASNFSLAMAAVASPPEGTPRPDAAAAVLSYLDVEERDVTDAALTSARFRFRVAVEALDAVGVAPEAVRLYRYHDGEWQTLATNLTGTKGGFHHFEAVSPGFSVFAIGLGRGAAGSADGTTTGTAGSESGAAPDTNDAGTATATQSGTQSDDGEEAQSDDSGGFGGIGGTTLSVGLFAAALLAAALWGYLLS